MVCKARVTASVLDGRAQCGATTRNGAAVHARGDSDQLAVRLNITAVRGPIATCVRETARWPRAASVLKFRLGGPLPPPAAE